MLKVKTKKTEMKPAKPAPGIYDLGGEPMEWRDWVLLMQIIAQDINDLTNNIEETNDDMLRACYKEHLFRTKVLERKLYKLATQ